MQAGMDAVGVFVQRNTPGDWTDQVANQTDRNLTPFNKAFDKSGLFVAFEDVAQLRSEFIVVMQDGLVSDPHARAFAAGFDEQGVIHAFLKRFIFAFERLKFGSRQVMPGEDALGHGFVKRERKRQHLGTCIGDLQFLKNGGDLRLA